MLIVKNIEPTLFANNPLFVSGAWILSSSIFTTYFTTTFLKYPQYGPPFLVLRRKKSDTSDTTTSIGTTPLLSIIDRPTLLTLLRFGGSFLLGLVARLDDLGQIPSILVQTAANMRYFIVSALFLFVANYSNSISLNRLGVPLTYTSKCAIPLFTVLFVICLDGLQALPNAVALGSLAFVALGIAAASWNSPSLDTLGFLAALTSATSQAALNIASKRAMALSHTSGTDALRVMVALAFFITATFSLVKYILPQQQPQQQQQHLRQISSIAVPSSSSSGSGSSSDVCPPFALALLAVIAYHIEYCLSFMFVRLVSPLTYGTCDAVRRLIIIIAGKS